KRRIPRDATPAQRWSLAEDFPSAIHQTRLPLDNVTAYPNQAPCKDLPGARTSSHPAKTRQAFAPAQSVWSVSSLLALSSFAEPSKAGAPVLRSSTAEGGSSAHSMRFARLDCGLAVFSIRMRCLVPKAVTDWAAKTLHGTAIFIGTRASPV